MVKKGKYVDGFTALKAAQRAAQEARAARGDPPVSDPTQAKKKDAHKEEKAKSGTPNSNPIASHARRTVMPTKYEVVCYECGFSFSQTGRSKSTTCPKCRAILDFVDHNINGIWSDTIKTAGKVIVQPDGTVTGGSIFASDVIVRGRITGGNTEAYRWLEVHEKADYDPSCVKANDLRVKSGKTVKLRNATFRNVELEGTLDANLVASGLVHIKETGHFKGTLTSEHLKVDEGGGLCADLNISPVDPPQKE